MKNKNNKIVAGLAATAIIALSFGSASAMGGNGGGQGYGLGKYATNEEKTKLQSLFGDERTEYMNKLKSKYNVSGGQGNGQGKGRGQGNGKGQGQNQAKQSGHNEDPTDLIADIVKSDVSNNEKEFLINQYGEEKMARDLYAYAATKYYVNTFSNISKSEQKHMETLQVLLDRYDIVAPSDYAKDNELYKTLKAKIDLSEKDAIEVGIMVEKVDIDNIVADIKATDNDDFKIILSNIGGASYNHLRGFINALNNNGYTIEIEYSDYLTTDEINTRGGGLKTKLAEKLEAEGFDLPEKASSKYIKENCDKEGANRGGGINRNYNGNTSNLRGQNSKNVGIIQSKKEQYKKLLNTKYKAKLDVLNEDKLKAILPKIDTLEEKVRTSTTYSESKKIQYMALFEAFREVIQERIGDDMIDNLLQ